MVTDHDAPHADTPSDRSTSAWSERSSPTEVRTRIERLIQSQPFAVLCTQGDGQPYGSVVALAATPDLASLVFATPVDTHKYRLLTQCNRVAIVVDSRPALAEDIMRGEAVTIVGVAEQVHRGPDRDRLSALLVERHPDLATFVAEPGAALFRVAIGQCTFVRRFQESQHWSPDPDTAP